MSLTKGVNQRLGSTEGQKPCTLKNCCYKHGACGRRWTSRQVAALIPSWYVLPSYNWHPKISGYYTSLIWYVSGLFIWPR